MFAWTEERTAELRQCVTHGMSASEVAAVLGTSRSSVIGRAHRLELQWKRARSPQERVARAVRKRERNKRKVAGSRPVARASAAHPLPPQDIPRSALAKPETKVAASSRGDCRF